MTSHFIQCISDFLNPQHNIRSTVCLYLHLQHESSKLLPWHQVAHFHILYWIKNTYDLNLLSFRYTNFIFYIEKLLWCAWICESIYMFRDNSSYLAFCKIWVCQQLTNLSLFIKTSIYWCFCSVFPLFIFLSLYGDFQPSVYNSWHPSKDAICPSSGQCLVEENRL